jgi:hypothetical protein
MDSTSTQLIKLAVFFFIFHARRGALLGKARPDYRPSQAKIARKHVETRPCKERVAADDAAHEHVASEKISDRDVSRTDQSQWTNSDDNFTKGQGQRAERFLRFCHRDFLPTCPVQTNHNQLKTDDPLNLWAINTKSFFRGGRGGVVVSE